MPAFSTYIPYIYIYTLVCLSDRKAYANLLVWSESVWRVDSSMECGQKKKREYELLFKFLFICERIRIVFWWRKYSRPQSTHVARASIKTLRILYDRSISEYLAQRSIEVGTDNEYSWRKKYANLWLFNYIYYILFCVHKQQDASTHLCGIQSKHKLQTESISIQKYHMLTIYLILMHKILYIPGIFCAMTLYT